MRPRRRHKTRDHGPRRLTREEKRDRQRKRANQLPWYVTKALLEAQAAGKIPRRPLRLAAPYGGEGPGLYDPFNGLRWPETIDTRGLT